MYINYKVTSIPLSLTFICESLGILKLTQIKNNIIAMNYFSMLQQSHYQSKRFHDIYLKHYCKFMEFMIIKNVMHNSYFYNKFTV